MSRSRSNRSSSKACDSVELSSDSDLGCPKGVVLLCGVYKSVQEAAGRSPRKELKS